MKRLLVWGLLIPGLIVSSLFRRHVAVRVVDPPAGVIARHPWLTLGAVGFALALAGLTVAVLGLIPMKASTGHWAITEAFLHFAMARSVKTHALWIDSPPLDDPALVARGAGHYDLGCRPCHGSVTGETPPIARRMVPPPRALNVHAPDWRPRELFYIVKHGMKFSGMPAWYALQRDDEVWAMVAFLRTLPTLDAQEYQRLTRGGAGEPFELGSEPTPSPHVVVETCARCHGVDGNGRGAGAFPKLAGQRAEYLDRALRAYAAGRRFSGMMGPIAASLTREDREHAVRHYASLPPASESAPRDDSRSLRGAGIAFKGVPDSMIPPCAECHGPAVTVKNPAYPRISGQYAGYLALQLRLLRDRRRGGSEYVHLMHEFVDRLTDEQIEDVTLFYSSVRP